MARMEGSDVGKKSSSSGEVKSTYKAKDELKGFNEERGKGEEFMSSERKPFCGACMWMDYQQSLRMHQFQRSQGVTNPSNLVVPNWNDYAGEEKFDFKGSVERRNRRDGEVTTERTFECKRNGKHSVTISDTKHYGPLHGQEK